MNVEIVFHGNFSLDLIELDLKTLQLLVHMNLAQVTLVVIWIIQLPLDLPLLTGQQDVLLHETASFVDALNN